MSFDLDDAIDILGRTPATLHALLHGAPARFTLDNEGEGTWSPRDVVAHLLHADQTDWMPRVDAILSGRRVFPPFDRHGHDGDATLDALLDGLREARAAALDDLRSRAITPADLQRTGLHPTFGEVTLAQLLSTWVAHDLCHLSQIGRVMAKRYKDDVGPWVAFLPTLTRP